MNQPLFGPDHLAVGGDFARVFDPEDYLTMVNALDEATVVLRAHLVLEEFLNIWAAKITGTEDLFDGGFVPFKTKLFICKNLGIDGALADVLDKVNTIRNRYSHRRKYKLEESALNGLKDAVDSLRSEKELLPCDKFEIYLEGKDASGNRKQITYTWESADVKKRLALVQVILVLKLIQWMQSAFNARGIQYNLVAMPAGAQ
jgi:hypothetical protein